MPPLPDRKQDRKPVYKDEKRRLLVVFFHWLRQGLYPDES